MTSTHTLSEASERAVVIEDASACREIWGEAASTVASLSPFLTPDFQDGLARIVKWKRIVIQMPDAGTASVFIRSRGPIKDLVLPPFCPFSAVLPPLDGSPFQPARFMEPIDGVPGNRLLSFPPSIGEDTFAGQGAGNLEVTPRFTFHLPTAPLESALARWSSSQRRSFRNYKDDYRFTVSLAPDETSSHEHETSASNLLNDLVDLTEAGYKRHGRALPLPSDGLKTWARELLESSTGRLYALQDLNSGALEAGVLALHHDSMAWYWLAGSRPGPAMTVLMAHIQDDLFKAGIPILDLMGANTPGITEFKRRFGGEKVRYFHVHTSTLAGRLSERFANSLRRILP